jgi:hypothetical protein
VVAKPCPGLDPAPLEGYVRVFADEGAPIASLLGRLRPSSSLELCMFDLFKP